MRIPRKNIKVFHGAPIIAYSIDTARKSQLFHEIYVSTEDPEIAQVAQKYGAKVIDRPSDLAEVAGAPDCGTHEVTRHGIQALRDQGISCDYACCIYSTAPLMTPDDLKGGFYTLTGTPPYDFVFSTGFLSGNENRRAEFDAGQWYWGTARAFLERRRFGLMEENCFRWVLPGHRVCDINTVEDWAEAESAYAELFIKPKTQAYARRPSPTPLDFGP